MKNYYFTICLLLLSVPGFSQTSIYGKVTDESTCEELIYANVVISKKGVFFAGASTDFEGNYSIPVDPGTYDIKISYTGYPDTEITGLIVKAGHKTNLDIQLKEGIELGEVIVTGYKVPLISHDCTTSGSTLTSEMIRSLPTKNISAIAATAAGLSSGESGSAVTIRGSRDGATDYYIDGIRVSGASSLISSKPISEHYHEDFLTGTEAAFGSATEVERIYIEKTDHLELAPPPPPVDPPSPRKEEKKIKAGILTAGEWNPLKHWAFWTDLLNNQDKNHKGIWKINPKTRYKVKVTNTQNIPLPNTNVDLIDLEGNIHWAAVTDNRGIAELWGNLYEGTEQHFELIAEFNGTLSTIKTAKAFRNNKVNKIKIPVACEVFNKADILFVVDATGSMGDEIRYLQSELQDVINSAHENNPRLDIQTGSVFYRDQSDEYVTRVSPLSNDLDQTNNFIKKQYASGGGDYPEAVHSALDEAVKQDWRPDAIARIVFLLLDAPPHQQDQVIQNLQGSIRAAAAQGIRIIPIAASGINPSTEFLMKAISIATNGTYVFITDDSGVGNAHLKPTVSDFEIELLNELMIRLITDFTTQKRCNSIIDRPESIAEENINVNIYPNPAQNYLMIETEYDLSKLDILSVNGQLVQSHFDLAEGVTRIDLSNFIDGIYILQFHNGNDIVSKKLIVSKDNSFKN